MQWHWTMYYSMASCFINQHEKDYDLFGDYFRYFRFKFSVYKASKSKIPALYIELIVVGVGFEFNTHSIN